jgi:hypothetical protein
MQYIAWYVKTRNACRAVVGKPYGSNSYDVNWNIVLTFLCGEEVKFQTVTAVGGVFTSLLFKSKFP